MNEERVTATQFKARCLRILDDVAGTGRPVVVTKHGRPVARVAPVEEPRSLLGSVSYEISDEELISASMGVWDIEAEVSPVGEHGQSSDR